MATMLKFTDYVRRYSLFRASQFQAPVIYPMTQYQLPRRAILHFVALDGVALGPQLSDPLMRRIPGVIYIDHAMAYDHPIGSPIKSPGVNANGLVNTYRQRNRAIRPLKNLERLEADDRSLVIVNYSILSHLVRYPVSFRAHFYQWFNVYKELVNRVDRLAETSERQQFIELELPEVIPPLAVLNAFSNNANLSADTMKKLRTNDELMVADLFLWAGKNRSRSVLGKLDPKHYPKVNLIVRRLNGFVAINLGWLDQWRKNPEIGRTKGMEARPFSLMLLKLLTTLHHATSMVATPTQEEVTGASIVVDENNQLDEINLNLDEQEELKLFGSEELLDDDEQLAALEKELEELDKLKEAAQASEAMDEEGNVVEVKTIDTEVLQTITTGDYNGPALMRKADELAGKGLLTAGEYRRLERVSEIFHQIDDPYGSGAKLHEAMQVTHEDIAIQPDVLSKDPVIIDKSLTHSRVDVFDRQYITKVLKKDILRSVAALQRAPVSITGYSVERDTDASNDREIHTIKITPAVGDSSTVKVIAPVIKPDGVFRYNGTDYRMRKQRAD